MPRFKSQCSKLTFVVFGEGGDRKRLLKRSYDARKEAWSAAGIAVQFLKITLLDIWLSSFAG